MRDRGRREVYGKKIKGEGGGVGKEARREREKRGIRLTGRKERWKGDREERDVYNG